MRHLLRVAISFFVLVFVAPAHVEAGLFSWLDRLSGPGPFWSVDFGIAIRCPESKSDPLRGFATDGFTFSCPNEDLSKPGFNWYLTAGLGRSIHNNLNYGDRPAPAPSTAIGLLKMGTVVDYRLDASLDVGVGAGFMYFGGPSFVNFARPYFQPLRVTVRPLLLGCDKPQRKGWLLMNFNLNMIVGTIDGAAFGAPGDPWRAHNEIVPEVTVGVDFAKFHNPKTP